MVFESKVLACFLKSRDDYDMVHPHIDRAKLSPYGGALLETIDEYYGADDSAESVDLEVIKLALDRRFKDIPRNQAKMRDALEGVLSVKTSSVNVMREVLEQKRADIGTHLADALLAQDAERIQLYLSEYESLTDVSVLEGSAEEECQGITLDALEERLEEDGCWQIAPKAIGDRIAGGIRAGHAVVLAARPERGKTLFGTTMNSSFLQQGAKTLYIGNEDPMEDLIIRLLCNMTGYTQDELFVNKERAMELAIERGYNNCVFASLSPGTLYEIEALVRRHEPDIVIVDQMRNIRANTENNTLRLEAVAQELRNMARRHQFALIELTQVGDSGRNKKLLDDGDIDGSNTGIPGACDVIIMIGSDDDFEKRDLRMVNLAKNKRGGNHESFAVSVDREKSRVMTYAT